MTANVITPILVGVAPDVDKSAFLWGMQAGQRVDSPSIIWAVTGSWGTIVMDTGSGTPEWVSAHHRPFRRTPEQEPLRALTDAGVDPASVRTVLLSHLHYDHCANNSLFSAAEFVVHRAEVAYATAPYPVHGAVYEAPTAGLTPQWMGVAGRLRPVDGDVDLAPGVGAIHLPGHTPGMMGLVVETRTGRYVLAGDHCSLRENWEGVGAHRHIPSRTYVDLGHYYRSYEKIEGLDATVLPGHDIRVFDQKSYG
ncbi:N-acyl homoserine lactonase family protein [Micromonospora sp. WMMD998]|uniref:N-acyl homoserine lactonase family protein n=1 Tax=Micromonospora sp. WMMD998 TaxID=3016092 RepID=UPI00249CA0D3|nr:N-acyl homoserine lactonase family protein [Micromonospora sp. WMMD998]WFE38587.1 N-acyl homoserine lactonase family protein [Micromonospora sp. WMMD998]